jgi:hypothetical protein
MAHMSLLPEERAELARRLREGLVKAITSAEVQATSLDIAATFTLGSRSSS